MTTAGEGGMVTTNNPNYWEKIWSFKDHGKEYKKVFEDHDGNGFRWLHERFGSNFRLTEIQSAIGRSQIKKLKYWNGIRNKNAKILIDELSKCSKLRITKKQENINHAFYIFYCYLNLDALSTSWDRARIIKEITNLGYPAFEGTCGEVYLEKCFKNVGLSPKKRLINASSLSSTSLCFLTHPSIDMESMKVYAEIVKKVLIMATN